MAANQTQGWQFIHTTQILEHGRHKIHIVDDLTIPHKDIDGDNHFFISPNPLTALWHGFGNIACGVRLEGMVVSDEANGRLQAAGYTYLAVQDVTSLLHEFVVYCAEQAIFSQAGDVNPHLRKAMNLVETVLKDRQQADQVLDEARREVKAVSYRDEDTGVEAAGNALLRAIETIRHTDFQVARQVVETANKTRDALLRAASLRKDETVTEDKLRQDQNFRLAVRLKSRMGIQ